MPPQSVIDSAPAEFPTGTIPPGGRAIPQSVIAIPPQREGNSYPQCVIARSVATWQSLSQSLLSLLLANNASSIFH